MTPAHASRTRMEMGCVSARGNGRTMDIIKTVSALVLAGCTSAGCSAGSSPSGSPPGSPSAVSAPPLLMSLPIALADSASQAYTIWPFGVHGGGHALDGHPGFDF